MGGQVDGDIIWSLNAGYSLTLGGTAQLSNFPPFGDPIFGRIDPSNVLDGLGWNNNNNQLG